ncbi:MAG: hypothetical protein HYX26_01835 [Acidobacteriales bacterium]|nr:hypothetical protein [Terriglobales bacterium]
MARLKIPERHREGIARIAKLSADEAQSIRSALDSSVGRKHEEETQGTPADVATAALGKMAGVERVELRQVSEALASMYLEKQRRDVSTEEFVSEVADALEDVHELTPNDRPVLLKNLDTLLTSDLFTITTKVFDLKTESDKIYCESRILTDLRPVFGIDVNEGPTAMVVMHQLKLSFHQGGPRHQDVYIALDADDLEELKKVLERAEQKAATLRAIVKDVRLFGIKDGK